MQDNLYKIVEKFLLNNGLSFDKEELKLQIESHPSYPSLHAITGVLDHFGLENLALDVPQTNEVLQQLPKHFIAHIKREPSEEIILVTKKDVNLKLLFGNGKKEKISIDDFLNQWTGIVVVTDPDEIPASKKTNKIVSNKIVLSLLGLFVFMFAYSYVSMNTMYLSYFVLSGLGVFVSFLLVQHELGFHMQSIDKLCTATEKTSCNAVLNSKGASVFGVFKLSDLSFVYFTTVTVAIIVGSLTNTSLNTILTVLTIGTIPVVFYSLYYQAFVVKKWCPLCLATASILVLQSALVLLSNPFSLNFQLKGFLVFTISFLLVVAGYRFIKNIIKSNIQLKKSQIEAYKFKRNPSVFNALYKNNTVINTKIPDIQEIEFGNPKAKLQIVLVTNPLCGFCKAKHQQLDRLLQTNPDEVNAIIRFNINTSDHKNPSYRIANILLSIYQQDKLACKEAVHQIYTNGVDVDKWLETYKKYENKDNHAILETEKQWCNNHQINFTPAIYLNGKEYPREYELTDLPFFIEESQLVDSKGEGVENQNKEQVITEIE